MSDAHESDLPIEIQFVTTPMQQGADDAAEACPIDQGIESRLIALIVATQLRSDLLAATEGHEASVECQSMVRILTSLQTCLYDLRATRDVLAAA